jgi:hypothetical protein
MNRIQFRTMVTVLLLAGVLPGQTPKTQALLMALGANAKQMMAYQWKQRITVIRKGVPSATIIEEIRFDASGQPRHSTLSRPEQKRMGPLKARKAADIKEDVQEVMQLAGRYANPQQLSQAIQRGEIWEGSGGALRVQARSLIRPGDEVTLAINGSSYLTNRIDIRTQHEGSPVVIAADYQNLLNGPSMMIRMTVQIPGDNIVVTVEPFDFVRLAGPNVL